MSFKEKLRIEYPAAEDKTGIKDPEEFCDDTGKLSYVDSVSFKYFYSRPPHSPFELERHDGREEEVPL